MKTPIFNYPPHILVLQQLIQPALLIDNIYTVDKAVRLWIILRSLYAKNPDFNLTEFNYQQWRDFFFVDAANSHHKRDAKPTHQEISCACNKTIKELLFSSGTTDEKWQLWKKSFIENYQKCRMSIDVDKLDYQKPFGVTGKTIIKDFAFLRSRNWLTLNDFGLYQKNSQIPQLTLKESFIKSEEAQIDNDGDYFPFLIGDFESFAHIFSQPIREIQRFFIHPEYLIPSQRVRDSLIFIQRKFKEVWLINPVPPVRISYHSASLKQDFSCIVYPACIYYYQRGFYLAAYGQIPKKIAKIDYYNYRLERIKSLEILDWTSSDIPIKLREKTESNPETQDYGDTYDPLIEEIQNGLEEAYGLDFYQPCKEMLLRFPSEFHQRYIENTLRHGNFKKLDTLQAVIAKIDRYGLSDSQKQKLKQKIRIYQEDGYYTLTYRNSDNSVIMRLRSWSPNVEILLPLELRQRMKQDIQATWKIYEDDSN